MDHKETLETAISLLDGDRQAVYGDAFEQHSRIARFWSEILGITVRPSQVALCMVGMKMSRAIGSPDHEDSYVDMAAYAALSGEISERELAESMSAHPAKGKNATSLIAHYDPTWGDLPDDLEDEGLENYLNS